MPNLLGYVRLGLPKWISSQTPIGVVSSHYPQMLDRTEKSCQGKHFGLRCPIGSDEKKNERLRPGK
jgi:hypothetical protein